MQFHRLSRRFSVLQEVLRCLGGKEAVQKDEHDRRDGKPVQEGEIVQSRIADGDLDRWSDSRDEARSAGELSC
jgi:hypothetical protein